MRKPKTGLYFDRITYHRQVTQCLGAATPKHWFMAVAAPSESYPKPNDITAFRIPYGVFIKMNCGTWHAGPLHCETDCMNFYNLELTDTNIVDHTTHVYTEQNMQFEIVSEE